MAKSCATHCTIGGITSAGNAIRRMTLHPSPFGLNSYMAIVMQGSRSVQQMSADQYLFNILRREAVNTSDTSPVRSVMGILMPHIRRWGNKYLLSVAPSGSFAKHTAIASGTDIDLFLSFSEQTPNTLGEAYEKLFATMRDAGYVPQKQNVSIHVKVGSYDVDLVPAKRQNSTSADHSLYKSRSDSWIKTNVATHIATVRNANRFHEIRLFKIWRNQKRIDFPSFYLELTAIDALRGKNPLTLSDSVRLVLTYLRDNFAGARVVDPANTNNIISDDLTFVQRSSIAQAAGRVLSGNWSDFVT